MSWYKCVTLTCDFCDNIDDTSESLVAEARKVEDYILVDGKDKCPSCRFGEDEDADF